MLGVLTGEYGLIIYRVYGIGCGLVGHIVDIAYMWIIYLDGGGEMVPACDTMVERASG